MSIELPPYRPVEKRSSIKVMAAAIHALFMRELQTRFGGYRLGYLWAPIEVFLQIVIFLVMFGVIIDRVIPGISYSLFLVAGMVPFRMMQTISTRALGAAEANRGLLMYRSVKHIDVLIARGFLEFVIYFFTSVLLLCGLAAFDVNISLDKLHIVLLCWITLFLFSFGLSLIMMVVGFYSGELSKFIAIFFTVLYFASGVIYPIGIVPEPYLSYLLYNPFIHNLEMIRYSLSSTYPASHINMSYFLVWMLIVLLLGLMMYKAKEKDMIRSR